MGIGEKVRSGEYFCVFVCVYVYVRTPSLPVCRPACPLTCVGFVCMFFLLLQNLCTGERKPPKCVEGGHHCPNPSQPILHLDGVLPSPLAQAQGLKPLAQGLRENLSAKGFMSSPLVYTHSLSLLTPECPCPSDARARKSCVPANQRMHARTRSNTYP